MTKAFNLMVHTSLLIIAAFIIMLIYWEWFDDPDIYADSKYQILNTDSIYPGGEMELRAEGTNRYLIIPNTSIRTIHNRIVLVVNNTANAPPGPYDWTVHIPIPLFVVPGPHQYRYCASFQINPIKQKFACNKFVPFIVRAK